MVQLIAPVTVRGRAGDHVLNLLKTCRHPIAQWVCLFVCWSLTSLCHSNGHIETMPAREINPFTALTRIRDRRAITASGHDYALDHSAIGAGP